MMKQKIILIFMIGFLSKVKSQDKKFEFQLALGTTFSVPKTSGLSTVNVSGSPEIKTSINIGAYILPSVNYSLSEKYSIDFGIGYFLDRFSVEDKIGTITDEGNRSINQIQVPVNFNFHFSKDNSYQLGIGGFASFLVSATEKGDRISNFSDIGGNIGLDPSLNEDSVVSYDDDIKDNYNSLSFGAFIQLKKNISFTANKKGFILLRINQYLNSIKNIDSDIGQSLGLRNEKEPTTVNLGIGLIF